VFIKLEVDGSAEQEQEAMLHFHSSLFYNPVKFVLSNEQAVLVSVVKR
jgi:hypothetical protein